MIDKSKLHPNLIKEVYGERYKHWKPSWAEMRKAVRWSKANYRHVGDYSSVRAGAFSYLDGLYVVQLEEEVEGLLTAIQVMANSKDGNVIAQYLLEDRKRKEQS